MARTELRIHGMDCAEEVGTLRRELEPLDGVKELEFDLLAGQLIVLHDPGRIGVEQLIRSIARTGLHAEIWDDAGDLESRSWLDSRSLPTAASGGLLGAAFLLHLFLSGDFLSAFHAENPPIPVAALYLAAVIAGLRGVLPKAWAAARRLRPDMNLLLAVAVTGAIGIGQWLEAATVTFLFALSLLLESWSLARARRAVSALLDLAPQEATVLRGPGGSSEACEVDDCSEREDTGVEHEHRMAAAEVPLGSVVLVRPGERVPLDGVVIHGVGAVDQSPITGESVPAEKRPGEDVYAGTINGEGALEVRTTRAAEDTTLSRIIKLVGEAQRKRGASERFVERFAAIYTPAILLVALATLLIPPLLFGGEWSPWLYNALVLLVIGCPCALVLSTPVSIVCGLTSAARKGILIKGGPAIEAPAGLRCLALDKTGTLTAGRPRVRTLRGFGDHSSDRILQIAAALEARSEHPLARAIVEHAKTAGVRPAPATAYKALPGLGAEAEVDGRKYWIGSHRLLEERGQDTPEYHAELEQLAGEGCSVVVLGTERHVCGLVGLADEPRPEARRAVEELHRLGLEEVVMLTGDNQETGDAIGAPLGLDAIHAGLLPQDKVDRVESLARKWQRVGMVGDGVNDAPALARATLGIAMGAAGTDAAIETADVVIMGDDLLHLPWLIRHSRRTLGIIRANIVAALAVKAVFFLLAMGGMATLWMAVAADMGVSLVVVLNALRLLRQPRGD